MLLELSFVLIVLAAITWRQVTDNQVATGRKRRGQTQRQLILASVLASVALGYALLQPLSPPVDVGPVTVSLISTERELFGGSLVFNVTATRDFTMPSTGKAFYGSIERFDRAGRILAISNYTGNLNKWEFLTLSNNSGTFNRPYVGKPITTCVPVQVNNTGDPACIDRTTAAMVDNYSFEYVYTPVWRPLADLSGAPVKKGQSLILRQRVEGGLVWNETVDVKPFILDREYPEFALLISNATQEINVTVRNPTGRSISNATIHATFNQTIISGSSCGATNITFAWSTGTTQTALNTSLLNHYWLNFNGSNSFTAVLRIGTLPAWGGTLSAYCGTGGSGNSSAAYYAFGKEGQSGWMYGSRDGSTIVDLGPRGDNPDSSANYAVVASTGNWGNYSINRTGTANAYVDNAEVLNATDNLFTCRIRPWSVPTASTDSMYYYDDGSGYFQYFGTGGNFGILFYGANSTATTPNTNLKLDTWQAVGTVQIGKGSATNENVTQVINGASNSSINTNTAIVPGGKVMLGMKVSGLTWAPRFYHDECGFIKGQPVNIGVDWLSVFQNETLVSGNYTITSGADTTPPQYSSNSTSPTNGSQFTNYVSFNTSWVDASAVSSVIFNVNGTNYTMGSTTANFTSTKLAVGSYDWYSFANDTAGNRNQTPTYRFEMVPVNWEARFAINETTSNYTSGQTVTFFVNASNNTQATNVTGLALNVYLNGTLQSSSSSAFTNTTTWSALTTGRTLNYNANVTDTQNYSGTPVARSYTVHNITGYLRYAAPNTTFLNITNCSSIGTYTPQNQTSVYGSYNFSSNGSANLATYWKVNATSSRYSVCVSTNASGTGCTYLDTTARRVYTGITPASTVSFWTFFNCSITVDFNSAKDFRIQMNTSLG